jgi:1-acyl-sn-glycerol-3-phosphate acyltransferase
MPQLRLRPARHAPPLSRMRPRSRKLLDRVSDWFYNLTCFVCRPAFTISHNPILLHTDRIPRRGPFILAPNHLSPFDVPCLMAISPRPLDFVSVTELFQNKWIARFFTHNNAFPLDRNRVDTGTTRTIFERLEKRRAVVLFPEGNIRTPDKSVLKGGPFKPAVTRIARLANVPVMPCVILNTSAYLRLESWLPLRNTRYAINFGPLLHFDAKSDPASDSDRLRQTWSALYAELHQRTKLPIR